jgi:hypothetical protein
MLGYGIIYRIPVHAVYYTFTPVYLTGIYRSGTSLNITHEQSLGPAQSVHVHVTRTRNVVTLRRTFGPKMYAMDAKIHAMYAGQSKCVHVHVTCTRNVVMLRRTLVTNMYAMYA